MTEQREQWAVEYEEWDYGPGLLLGWRPRFKQQSSDGRARALVRGLRNDTENYRNVRLLHRVLPDWEPVADPA